MFQFIYCNRSRLTPGNRITVNAKAKVVQCPSNLKPMLEKCEDEAYPVADINTLQNQGK